MQKSAAITFYILLAIVLTNFVSNVFEFQGRDLIEMYHPAKLLVTSYDYINYNAARFVLLVRLIPVLVVCPAGFILLSEKNRKEHLLLIGRIGAARYYSCTMISAFIVTALVCTTPFLLELLLNCVSFPLDAIGDFWESNFYDATYIEMTQRYLFFDVYLWNPYIYAVVGMLFMGLFFGIMGMFTVAISAVLNIRYKIFLFLPVFFLLNFYPYIPESSRPPFSIRWPDYVFLFNDEPKATAFIIGLMLIPCIISILCIGYKIRSDQL